MRSDNTERDGWREADTYFKNCFDYLKDLLEYLTPEEIKKNKLSGIQKILLEEPKDPTKKDIENNNYDAIYPNVSGSKSKFARLQAAYDKWEKWIDKGGVISYPVEMAPVFKAVKAIKNYDRGEPHPSTHSIENLQWLSTVLVMKDVKKPVVQHKAAKSVSAPAPANVGKDRLFSPKPDKARSEPKPQKNIWPGFGKK